MYINDYSITLDRIVGADDRSPSPGQAGKCRVGVCGTVHPAPSSSDDPPGGHMSIWGRFCDWLLGVKLISMEDLETLEGKAVCALDDGFKTMNKTIDRNADGYVSVREAWAMVKVVLKTVKTIIGGLRR